MRGAQGAQRNMRWVKSLPFGREECPPLQRAPQRSTVGSVSFWRSAWDHTYMVLILQLRRLDLLELLRQGRHDYRGRQEEKDRKRAGMLFWR